MRKYFHCLGYACLGALLCLVAACSANTAADVGDDQLLAAVNAYLAQNPAAVISPSGAWGEEIKTLPFDLILAKQSRAKTRAAHPELFALADAGVLLITDAKVAIEGLAGKDEQVPGLHVALSEEGAKWYLPESGKLRFADMVAKQVTARRVINDQELVINVELAPENIAPWAENEAVQAAFPGLAGLLAQQQKQVDYQLKYDGSQWLADKSNDLTQ